MLVFSSADIGGAEKSLTRMALANEDAEIGYSLATLGRGDQWLTWASAQGIAASAFPVFGGRLPRVFQLRRLVAFCRDARPNLIYVVGMRAAFALRMLKPLLPPTLVVHAIRSSFPRGTALARRMRVSEFLLRHVTDHYVANSQKGAETLAQVIGIDAGKVSVIHNGVEIDAGLTREAQRPSGTLVSVVANLNLFKGHMEFLRVVQQVQSQVPGLQVTFVGRDDLGGVIQREIERRGLGNAVKLVGYQPNPAAFVANSRLFALPSRNIEGCPTAVMEAMALGKPVVAYRIGGLPELVRSGETGYLVEPGDEDGFADAMVAFLTDEALARRFGSLASATIAADFSVQQCARRHASLWHALAEAN